MPSCSMKWLLKPDKKVEKKKGYTIFYIGKQKTKFGEGVTYGILKGSMLLHITFVSKDGFKRINGVIFERILPRRSMKYYKLEKPICMSKEKLLQAAEKLKSRVLGESENFFITKNRSKSILSTLIVLAQILPLILLAWVIFKFAKQKIEEAYANKVEENLNKLLYGDKKPESIFHEYEKLFSALKALVTNKNVNGCVIYGPPGTGKTFMLRWWFHANGYKIGKDYVIYKGAAKDEISFINILYKNKDKIIVFDDFDDGLLDPKLINVLKGAMDSYPKRVISFPQTREEDSTTVKITALPQKFVFLGKIILITNLQKHEIPSAIKSRSLTVEINFTNEQVINLLKKGLKLFYPQIPLKIKMEIINYLAELAKKYPNIRIDFRLFKAALDLYMIDPKSWKRNLLEITLGK